MNLGQDPSRSAYWLRLRQEGLTFPQILERSRDEDPDWFPWTLDHPEYEQRREESIDAVKKTIHRLKARLKTAVDRADGPVMG